MTEHPNLATALAAVQADLPKIGKGNTAKVTSDKGSYSYQYADLADVSAAILPVLGKHGLSFSAKPTIVGDNRFVLEYTLRHSSGDSDVGFYPLQVGTPQQVGSAISYARRYALCAVTGVAPDQDDDGKAATEQYETASDEDRQLATDSYTVEIEHSPSVEALTVTLKSAMRSKSKHQITAAQYDRLYQLAHARRPELDQRQEATHE